MIAAAVTFIVYAVKSRFDGSKSLDVYEAFTSLALISLVTTPANEFLTAVPFTASCFGSFQRIQTHLLKQRLGGSGGNINNESRTPRDIEKFTGEKVRPERAIVLLRTCASPYSRTLLSIARESI